MLEVKIMSTNYEEIRDYILNGAFFLLSFDSLISKEVQQMYKVSLSYIQLYVFELLTSKSPNLSDCIKFITSLLAILAV